MEEKSALRKKYKAVRDSLGEGCAAYSSKICGYCMALPEFIKAKTVLLYFAKGSEVDLSRLAETALGMGKTVGYPRCVDGNAMVFHKISDLSELCKGAFGIMEPPKSAPVLKTEGGVCFVPALAYDCDGFRLGYGGGYYDRFLKGFQGCKIGVAYSACVTKKLPRGEHDQRTDYIITESQVKRTIES